MTAKAKVYLNDGTWFIIDALHYKINNIRRKMKFIKRIVIYDEKFKASYRPSFKMRWGEQ